MADHTGWTAGADARDAQWREALDSANECGSFVICDPDLKCPTCAPIMALLAGEAALPPPPAGAQDEAVCEGCGEPLGEHGQGPGDGGGCPGGAALDARELYRRWRQAEAKTEGAAQECCDENDPDNGYICTLKPGHDGDHIAHDDDERQHEVFRWPNLAPQPKAQPPAGEGEQEVERLRGALRGASNASSFEECVSILDGALRSFQTGGPHGPRLTPPATHTPESK